MNDPILRKERSGRYRFTVYGGLDYIRGNSAPYFSLTYWETGPGGYEAGGAGHEKIVARYPELADLAALHLSDIDGAPMYAEANGWYWLAGAMGGNGEAFHGGQDHSERECLAILAKHCRISEEQAYRLRDKVWMTPDPAHMRARWVRELDKMRPRWKREAEAAIKRHGLKVYGDPWTPNEEVPA